MPAKAGNLAQRVIASGDVDVVRRGLLTGLAEALTTEHSTLEDFVVQAWPIIEPETPLSNSWYVGYLCEYLTAVIERQITRLAISIKPRAGKSNIATILMPCWAWTERPWHRFIMGSYSAELAVTHSLRRRRVMDSEFYQARWGKRFQIMEDQNRKGVFENTLRGHMYATGIGGTVTGFGANTIILDDPINPKQAMSKTERAKAVQAYTDVFSNRLDDKKSDAIIVVAQRTHKDDLTGHVLKLTGHPWEHVDLPAIAEENRTLIFPMTGRKHEMRIGDALDPQREPPAVLEKEMKDAGTRTWKTQWQQKPVEEEGNLIKRHWWKYYNEDPRVKLSLCGLQIQTWDLNVTDTAKGSFMVGLVLGMLGADVFLADMYRERPEFTDGIKGVQDLTTRWPRAVMKLMENKANGPAAKSVLKAKIPGIILVEPLGSKEERIAACTPYIEAGNVWLPNPYDANGAIIPGREWVVQIVDECAHAPAEPNDIPDALSQGLVKLYNVVTVGGDEGETEDAEFFEEGAEALL